MTITITTPRSVCPDHSRYVAGCADCREKAATRRRAYTRLSAYGQWPGLVDAKPVIDHLVMLLASGMTQRAIRTAAGLGNSSIDHILNGSQPRLRADTARKFLDVQPETVPPRFVSSLGVSRRLQALMATGWDAATLATLLGASAKQVRCWRSRSAEHIHYANHARICAVYQQIGDRRGPSVVARGQGRQRGYAPPICWDDDGDLDDPNGKPKGFKALKRASA